jgi:hypothetical protein
MIEKNGEKIERKNKEYYMADKNYYRILTPNAEYGRGLKFHKVYYGMENTLDFIYDVLMPTTILGKMEGIEDTIELIYN